MAWTVQRVFDETLARRLTVLKVWHDLVDVDLARDRCSAPGFADRLPALLGVIVCRGERTECLGGGASLARRR